MDISKIDNNFMNYYDFEGMERYNINKEPFKLYGLCRNEDESDFKRLPHSVAESIDNNSIKLLYKNTSGIRLRFRTNSQRIILSCVLPQVSSVPHMPLTGTSCFDIYVDGRYYNVFRPGIDEKGNYADATICDNRYASGYTFPDRKEREILINFPLYNDVNEVFVYLEKGCNVKAPEEYKYQKPAVFYGSSITQGGCASHPGNCYPAIISRRVNCDFINLGFSAGCFGELQMADYISTLEKSILIYDYDHNAPTAEFLEKTHERFFKRIRELNHDLPVIMISAADLCFSEAKRKERKAVIYKTYKNAVDSGDKNVYFIDGEKIYSQVGVDYCLVDNTHPNDLGFYCMAETIIPILQKNI